MAIKFEDIKDDEAAKKPKAAAKAPAAKAPTVLPPAEGAAQPPAEPLVPGGLPFEATAEPSKSKRKGRPPKTMG
jgi:hypothetical protein